MSNTYDESGQLIVEDEFTAIVDLTDDDILKYTQRQRKRLVVELTAEGMPTSNDERTILLATLNDMDRTALSKKKINAATAGTEADRTAAMAIAKLYAQLGNYNPAVNNAGVIPEPDQRALPQIEVADGETDIGIANETYDEFMARMES